MARCFLLSSTHLSFSIVVITYFHSNFNSWFSNTMLSGSITDNISFVLYSEETNVYVKKVSKISWLSGVGLTSESVSSHSKCYCLRYVVLPVVYFSLIYDKMTILKRHFL
jgi:hypothetical protein